MSFGIGRVGWFGWDRSQKHDVVGQDQKHEFAALRPVVAGVDDSTEAAFDHREHRLDLPTLSIAAIVFVEASLHVPAMAASRRLGCGSADFGGDERTDAALLPGVAMVGLRVIARIGKDVVQQNLVQGLIEKRLEAIDVHTWSAARKNSQNEVGAAIDRGLQLGEGLVRNPRAVLGLALCVVGTGMTALEARGVKDSRA